ncbi:MAG: ABC transporter permease subunit [Clostridiales bacterium]|jgi:putative aldouronate transport system permease protein|nr:ABC transporter permease subunit [Clostridiales bacterium]
MKSEYGGKDFKDNLIMCAMCLPVFAYILIFCYAPMFGLVIAFKDYRVDLGILGSKWVGLENFKFFFTSIDAFRVTANTIYLNFLFIAAGTAAAVVLALLLFEVSKKWLIKAYQTFIILPSYLSWVVVGFMTYAFFNPSIGLMNKLIGGVGGAGVDWYAEASVWPAILTIAVVWKNIGLNCVIYYAGLTGINHEYYEAAAIDGAGRLKQMWYISIPSITPLISIMTILAIGGVFRSDFGMFFNLTRDIGTLYPTTDVIDTYIYRALRVLGNEGMSAAVGLYQSVVGFILIMVTNTVANRFESENALF